MNKYRLLIRQRLVHNSAKYFVLSANPDHSNPLLSCIFLPFHVLFLADIFKVSTSNYPSFLSKHLFFSIPLFPKSEGLPLQGYALILRQVCQRSQRNSCQNQCETLHFSCFFHIFLLSRIPTSFLCWLCSHLRQARKGMRGLGT